jgi:hypothetical protein
VKVLAFMGKILANKNTKVIFGNVSEMKLKTGLLPERKWIFSVKTITAVVVVFIALLEFLYSHIFLIHCL